MNQLGPQVLLSTMSGFPKSLIKATRHQTLPQGLSCPFSPSHVQYSCTSHAWGSWNWMIFMVPPNPNHPVTVIYILRGVTTTGAIQVVNNHYPAEGYKEKIFCQMLQFFFLNIHFVLSLFSRCIPCPTHPGERETSRVLLSHPKMAHASFPPRW